MNIYVGNLPYSINSEELRSTFERYGVVNSAEIIMDRRTNRSRGYGFVEMADEPAARRAIAELNGHPLHGRAMRVDASNNQHGEVATLRPAARRPATQRHDLTQPSTGGVFSFFRRLFG